MNKEELELAHEARKMAYAKYSNFTVGAALKCKNGKIYTGCNIENHGIMSICAERVAFVKAISEGEKEFERITVVGGNSNEDAKSECMPCGYCREFMSEFVDSNFKICVQNGDTIKEYTMNELLPHNFKN